MIYDIKTELKQQYSGHLARLFSAICLFLLLAKANVWLDTLNNSLLAFGYRFFIIFVPVLFLTTKRYGAFVSFLFVLSGIILWLNQQYFVGTLFVAIGFATGGYFLKQNVVSTVTGAGLYKISLNVGSLLAGGLIAILPEDNNSFLLIGLFLIILASFFSYPNKNLLPAQQKVKTTNFSFKEITTKLGFIWILVGIVTGIKLVSIFTILPQYIIEHHGYLPNWYGLAIIANGIIIIFFQMPIIKLIDGVSFKVSMLPLAASMIIIAFPQLFFVWTVLGALLWTLLLSLLECMMSYQDKLALHGRGLLIKETFVGIGSAVTVFLSRSFVPSHGALLIGIIGIVCVLLGIMLYKKSMFS